MQNENQKGKCVSLVVIRIEIDDLNEKSANITNLNFNKTFTYSSSAYLNKQQRQDLIASEAFSNLNLEDHDDTEDIKQFIGKRQSQLIKIETYFINSPLMQKNDSNQINKTSSKNFFCRNLLTILFLIKKALIKEEQSLKNHNNKNSAQQQFVTNAMTMQQALETAYNDWNKQKITSSPEINNTNEQASIIVEEKDSKISHSTIETVEAKSSIISSFNMFEANESNSILNVVNTTEIPFYYGNPTVDLVKGFIHIYKDW